MNLVALVGRISKDPVVRETNSGTAVGGFNLAVDRPYTKGEEKKTDFISVKCFGKQAEFVGKYLEKGRQIAVTGRIQTGSYEKQDGSKVYTTDVIADRIEFVGKKEEHKEQPERETYAATEDFSDIPF